MMMDRRVLILSYFFPPYGGGSVARAHAFVKYLPCYGWAPRVLTVKETYYDNLTRDDSLLFEYCESASIFRTRSLEPSGKVFTNLRSDLLGARRPTSLCRGLVKQFLHSLYNVFIVPDEHILWMPYAIRAASELISSERIEVILATTPPHSVGVIGSVVSRKNDLPLVLDVRDDWIGNPLFDIGYWHKRRVARQMEKFVINSTDKVVVATPESKHLLMYKYPDYPESSILIIRNGYDRAEFERAKRLPLPDQKRAKLRIIYTGGLPAKRSPEELFIALLELGKEVPVHDLLQVDFYGFANQDFLLLCKQMGLDKIVRFHGHVSRQEAVQQLFWADVGLVIIPESEGSKTVIPGKVYEYIGSGIYILGLCSENSAVAEVIRDYEYGVVVPMSDVLSIKNELSRILEMHQGKQLSSDLNSDTLAVYERSNQVSSLASVLDDCTWMSRRRCE